MNEMDRRLLDLLRGNARMPISELARKLGLSRTTVQQRIHRLEDTGVINGYTLRFGENHQRSRLQAYVNLVADPGGNEALIDALAKMPQVETLYSVSGKIDFVAVLNVDDTRELDAALDHVGKAPGIRSTETAIVLSKKFDRR